MLVRRWVLAAALLVGTTGCGASAVEQQSKAALAAANKCTARFDRQFHPAHTSRSIDEGFVHDLGGGRLRLTGSVPGRAGLAHGGTYTCVVAAGLTGLRITRFDVKRATTP